MQEVSTIDYKIPFISGSVLSGDEIRRLALDPDTQLIEHFLDTNKKDRRISGGCSVAGYDIRLGPTFKILNGKKGVLDIKNVGGVEDEYIKFSVGDRKILETYYNPDIEDQTYIDLEPGQCILGSSLERFNIPTTVVGICFDKSTYARTGLISNVTPIEPGWSGFLTIELYNQASRPIRIYVGEGIIQAVFFNIVNPSETGYGDRGTYQLQPDEPITPRVRGY